MFSRTYSTIYRLLFFETYITNKITIFVFFWTKYFFSNFSENFNHKFMTVRLYCVKKYFSNFSHGVDPLFHHHQKKKKYGCPSTRPLPESLIS